MEPFSSELATDLAAYLAAHSIADDYLVSAYSISVELVNAAPLLLLISLVFNSSASSEADRSTMVTGFRSACQL